MQKQIAWAILRQILTNKLLRNGQEVTILWLLVFQT